jgi:hypothetical protein
MKRLLVLGATVVGVIAIRRLLTDLLLIGLAIQAFDEGYPEVARPSS